MAVHLNAALLHIIEPQQQFYHRRFPSSGRAYDCHRLPGLYLAVKVMDDNFIRVIAKLHMGKIHPALHAGKVNRVFRCHIFLVFPKELKDPLRCRCRGLQHIGNLRHLGNRLGELADVLDKGLDFPYLYAAPDGKHPARHGYCYVSKVPYKPHNRLHHPGQKLGFPCRLV